MQPVKVETKNPNRPYRKCFSGEEYASYRVLKNSSSFSASSSDARFDSCYVGFKELTSHEPCLPLSLILRSYHCSQLAVFISTLTPLLQHITKSKDLKIIVWRLSPKSNLAGETKEILFKIIPFYTVCMCHVFFFYSISFFFCCYVYSEKTWVGRDIRIRMLNVVNTTDKKKKTSTILLLSIHTGHRTIIQQKKISKGKYNMRFTL